MTHTSKSAILSAVYTMFQGLTLYWDWDDGSFDLILSTSKLPAAPQEGDVSDFLAASNLLAWRLAIDGKGVWQGQEPASDFIGAHEPWQVDCWYAPEKTMASDAVVSNIMRLATQHPAGQAKHA